jgi:hypothetical protein
MWYLAGRIKRKLKALLVHTKAGVERLEAYQITSKPCCKQPQSALGQRRAEPSLGLAIAWSKQAPQ